jgi:hypothetical protein
MLRIRSACDPLSGSTEINGEVDSATRSLEAMISAHLAAGADRCVLAAACVWSGVKEMSEVTNSQSAAAALRAIANQIDPPAEIGRPRVASSADRALIADTGQYIRAGGALNQKAATRAGPNVADNPDIADEIVGEAIDLLDQGHATQARALLMALRARLYCSPPRRPPAGRGRREQRHT